MYQRLLPILCGTLLMFGMFPVKELHGGSATSSQVLWNFMLMAANAEEVLRMLVPPQASIKESEGQVRYTWHRARTVRQGGYYVYDPDPFADRYWGGHRHRRPVRDRYRYVPPVEVRRSCTLEVLATHEGALVDWSMRGDICDELFARDPFRP